MLSITTRIGMAAAHIVCSDLLMAGYTASLAAEGASYDVVLDVEGRVFRVQVKGTSAPTRRRSRQSALAAYQFMTTHGHRPDANRKAARIKRYDRESADMLALVAIDARHVAYMPITDHPLPSGLFLYPAGTVAFVRAGKEQRRCIDHFPLKAAVDALLGTSKQKESRTDG